VSLFDAADTTGPGKIMKSLNHIYRTIWSEALGVWIAVSEITKSKGKRSTSSCIRTVQLDAGHSINNGGIFRIRLKPIAFTLACCFALNAQANPLGGTVVNGQASFNTSGNTLTVTNTPGAIINWQGFSIGANEVTHFAQQSASSTVLNHVVTNNPSVILGTLSSNGQVYLVNANGIMFGAGSTVDVAGLVATTLNLSDADFLAGRHNYTAVPGAQNISNSGNITAQQGGQIYLIAPNVENNGIIKAPNGEVLLAAGNSVELVNSNEPSLRVKITAPAGDATNLGKLIVGSGSLGLFGTMVKNNGIVSADSATMQGGKIVFKSSQTTEVTGTVSATGTTGGTIEILGNQVALLGNASVDASGVNGGGTVLVGGDAHGANSNIQNAQVSYVDATATIKADAQQNGSGGKVVVWADKATQFSGNISARGGALSGNGGWVETSGKQWLGFAGLVNTTAAHGAIGSLLLDPMDVTISTALNTVSMTATPALGGTTPTTFADPSTGLSTSNLNVTTLTGQLALSNVTVNTTGGFGAGNITVQTPIAWASASSLTLNATGAGAIVTNAGSTITNTGTGGLIMQTAGGSITLNAGVTLANGAFTANAVGATGTITINAPVSTGTGAINLTAGSTITEGAGGSLATVTDLTGTLGKVTTSSVGGTTLNGANSIAIFSATNTTTGNIVLNNTSPGSSTTFGVINSATGGSISLTNAGTIFVNAPLSTTGGGAINLTATGTNGSIGEMGQQITTTGTLTTSSSSSSGTSLNGGGNFISNLNATASGGGMVFVQNSTALNLLGVTGTGVLISTNVGGITVSGPVNGGTSSVSLQGFGITNNSTITGAGGVTLTAGYSGFAPVGTLTNTGTITNGGGTNTAAINLNGDIMVLNGGTVTAGAAAVNLNNVTSANAINIGSTTDVASLTLELSNAELATISTTGLVSIGNTGNSGAITIATNPINLTNNTALVNGNGGIAVNSAINAGTKNLTLNSSGTVTQSAGITAAGLELLGTGSYTLTNIANTFATVAGNAGSISLFDSAALSVGTVNTAGLTSTGTVSLTSGGAISQTAAISSSGLTTSSVGGTVLNGANTVTSFSATNTTSGNISLTNTAPTLTALGIGNAATGGSINVNNAGSISIMGTIAAAGGGAINLTSLGSISETSTGQISTTGLLTTSSVTGQNLVPLGTNTVGSFNATNTKIGAINFANVGAPLTVTGVSQIGSGAVNISNTGDLSTIGGITTSGTAATAVTLTSSGNVNVGGTVTGAGGGALNLVLNHGSVGNATVAGKLDLLGGSLDVQSLGVTGTGTLNVAAGAISKSGALTAATLVNNGWVYVAGGSNVTGVLTQNGLLDIAAGGILTTPGFTNTGTLSGVGTLNLGTGTLTNNGIIAPGGSGTVGTFTITGNLVMGATGSLNMDVINPTAGNFDFLNVLGAATLTGGTLNISGATAGTYSLLSASNGLGSTKFAAINSGFSAQTPTYTANSFTVDLQYGITDNQLSELVKEALVFPRDGDGRRRSSRLASNDSGRVVPRGVVPKTVCQ
jgi:filamentous hemagglutinin family protein